MSTQPGYERQTSGGLNIPSRQVIVKDASELPNSYCTTPGGTMFSTTPGGSRIIYDRKFLLQMKNSPVAKTPPVKLVSIPDICNEDREVVPLQKAKVQQERPKDPTDDGPEEDQFHVEL
eukprot:Em0010g717a